MLPAKVLTNTRHAPFLWIAGNPQFVAGGQRATKPEYIEWFSDSWFIVENLYFAPDTGTVGGNYPGGPYLDSSYNLQGIRAQFTRLRDTYRFFSEPIQCGAFCAGPLGSSWGFPVPIVIPPGDQYELTFSNTELFTGTLFVRIVLQGTRVWTL